MPFDPKFWWEKNQNRIKHDSQIWKELSDEEFDLVDSYTDKLWAAEGITLNRFVGDLTALTDQQFDEFDKLTDDGIGPDAAYALCLRATPSATSRSL